MNTVLKFDKYVLVKELNDNIKNVGDVFEIASVSDGSFILKGGNEGIELGIVNFEDFEKYFVKEDNFKGWTNWTALKGFDGQSHAFYRTNRRKTQVRF